MVTNEPFTHGSQQSTVSEGLYFRRDFPIWTSTKNVFPGLVHRHISIFHEIDTECVGERKIEGEGEKGR